MSRYTTTNPATGETLATFDELTDEQLEQRLAASQEAYRAWRAVDVAERAAVLARAADLYEERAEELARTITREMGKPISAARREIVTVTGIFRYYAEQGPAMLEVEKIDVQGPGSAYVRREAIGPLLGVMPWNFPHYQVARFAAPNLLLGNTILLKHAGICAQTGEDIARLLADAGLPDGAFTNLFATHEQVERIIADPRVQGVSLTGSDAAGARIGAQAGQNVKKSVLELGGSDPFIVLDDADLDAAAQGAVLGRMVNGGQVCTSAKRIIVLDAVYDEFLERFTARMEQLPFGDPTRDETIVGPLSSAAAVDEVAGYVDDAVAHGAELVMGGRRGEGAGAFYEPTVLTGVTKDAKAYYEEIFGPVAVIHRVPDEDAAVELANDSPYGLSSTVYTTDTARAEQIGARLEVGMVWVNSPSASSAELPFGGVKRSGHGRELGSYGVEEFANHKLIRIVG